MNKTTLDFIMEITDSFLNESLEDYIQNIEESNEEIDEELLEAIEFFAEEDTTLNESLDEDDQIIYLLKEGIFAKLNRWAALGKMNKIKKSANKIDNNNSSNIDYKKAASDKSIHTNISTTGNKDDRKTMKFYNNAYKDQVKKENKNYADKIKDITSRSNRADQKAALKDKIYQWKQEKKSGDITTSAAARENLSKYSGIHLLGKHRYVNNEIRKQADEATKQHFDNKKKLTDEYNKSTANISNKSKKNYEESEANKKKADQDAKDAALKKQYEDEAKAINDERNAKENAKTEAKRQANIRREVFKKQGLDADEIDFNNKKNQDIASHKKKLDEINKQLDNNNSNEKRLTKKDFDDAGYTNSEYLAKISSKYDKQVKSSEANGTNNGTITKETLADDTDTLNKVNNNIKRAYNPNAIGGAKEKEHVDAENNPPIVDTNNNNNTEEKNTKDTVTDKELDKINKPNPEIKQPEEKKSENNTPEPNKTIDYKIESKVNSLNASFELQYSLYNILDRNGYIPNEQNCNELFEGLLEGRYMLLNIDNVILTESSNRDNLIEQLLESNNLAKTDNNISTINKLLDCDCVLFY